MIVPYDIDESSNWEKIYFGEFKAIYIPGKQIPVYTPIPKTNLNLTIDSPLIAIYCQSSQYPNSKKYLGSVYQTILGPTILPTPQVANKGKTIYANETVLADFSGVDDSYDLVLNVRWWVEQIQITIFKYLKEIDWPIEDRLSRIEEKIDSLL